MEFKDYYKTLGVAADATPEQVKQAYRKLARKYHPDVSKEAQAEEKFKEVGEAYEVLKDKEKRASYDQLRQQGWHQGQTFRPPPGWQKAHSAHSHQHARGGPSADFSDFFRSIFGEGDFGAYARNTATRGGDISFNLAISLEEAYHGGHQTLQIPIQKIDEHGRLTTDTRTIKVNIPKGVAENQQIRLKQQGDPGSNGGPNGDLYFIIKIKPHPVFILQDKDIHVILPIAPWEAALGAKIKVPTLGGIVEVKIPPNSQTGQKLRLSKRGLPGEPAGDEIVQLQIVNPPEIQAAAKKLYEELSEHASFNPRKGLGV